MGIRRITLTTKQLKKLPVAQHDPSEYGEWDEEAMKDIFQYGVCGCGQTNRSYAKYAICIKCKKSVYLT